jgi:hypothetical protein
MVLDEDRTTLVMESKNARIALSVSKRVRYVVDKDGPGYS